MAVISVRVPDSIVRRLEEPAKRENVSVDQFVSIALAEKISAILTRDYLDERAKRGSRDKFEQAMKKVPDVEPEPFDSL